MSTIKVRLLKLKESMGTKRNPATWIMVSMATGYTTMSLRNWRNGVEVPSKRALKAIRDAEDRYEDKYNGA